MINAIQQLGLGVEDKQLAFEWFVRVLGFCTVVFDEQGEAKFMTRYTGGEVCKRDAALLLNGHGGSGLEIWQHLSRKPLAQEFRLRSTGFLIAKLHCKGLEQMHRYLLQEQKLERIGSSEAKSEVQSEVQPKIKLGTIVERPTGEKCFYFSVFGTWFQMIESKRFFCDNRREEFFCAGISGVVVGVSDIEKSLQFYRNVLGYEHVLQDKESEWADWQGFVELDKANASSFRRVLLERDSPEEGPFASLFGPGEIELVQVQSKPLEELQQVVKESLHLSEGQHLYSGRCWGDPGLIHLCFDVRDMAALKAHCAASGVEFTVDTGSEFFMNNASGRFAYLEDPDGSLIEFVETSRVPLWGKFSLKVQGRRKTLPRWMLKFATRDNIKSASKKKIKSNVAANAKKDLS